MEIVILGAGISGCSAYLLLKKHLPKPLSAEPHSITIFEAHDSEAGARSRSTLVVGGGLGVGANGLNVLKRLDEDLLLDVVRGGYVVPTMKMKAKGGALLARTQPGGGGEAGADMHMVASSRHALWTCLRARIPDGAIVTKTVARVVARPEGRNLVVFADGSPPVEADLVIGADGVKSVAKHALFPEADQDPFPPQYEGLVGVGGFVPSALVRDRVEKGSMNFVFGGNGFFGYFFANSAPSSPHRESPFHLSEPGDTLAWWSTFTADECPTASTLDADAVTRQLQGRHKDWKDPVVQAILPSLRVENMYPTWTVPPLPTWERDGVVLIGDAAHALPPTSGQGSSQALEDAEAFTLFLSHHLRRAYQEHRTDTASRKRVVKTAAKQYMELRIPRVSKILHDAQKRQNSKRDMSVLEEYLMYLYLWIMGCFPSLLSKPVNDVFRYNVAEEVKKRLGKAET
ncbi:hypothetical protein CDD83_9460 [Cordyceps sp. RAO-2017]|nr:hypothetical protein CDD83_9460 [Cordyceps sp. RAO-2017]